MSQIFILFLLLASASHALSGEFLITHAPTHVTFDQKGPAVRGSQVSEVIASTFGFSPNEPLTWAGLKDTSLFARPKANVVINVAGANQDINVKTHAKYVANMDDGEFSSEPIVDKLQSAIANPLIVDFSQHNTLFDIRSVHPALFNKLPVTLDQIRDAFHVGSGGVSKDLMQNLNISNDDDLLFLGEMHIMDQIIKALNSHRKQVDDLSPDFFHLKVTGIQKLAEIYGTESAQVHDAHRILEAMINKVTLEFRRLYSGNVIVQVLTQEFRSGENQPKIRQEINNVVYEPKIRQELNNIAYEAKIRHSRSLMAADDTTAQAVKVNMKKALGVAVVYSGDYSVVFQILLWGMIVLALAIFAIAYGIWNMDPGRDSIIYRMTTTRLKKD